MPNINDIVKKTGYSKSTVSRALNHKGRLSQGTRERVLKAAKEINYFPNSKAVSLSTGKSDTLGAIVPYSTFNSYHNKIMNGILNEAFEENYKITFLPTHYDRDVELSYLRMLQTKEYDGLIITSAANDYYTIAEYLQYGPIVSCEDTGNSEVPSVALSRTEGYGRILDELLEKGIHQIGICLSRTIEKSYNAKTTFDLFSAKVEGFTRRHVFENCRSYYDGIKAAEYFSCISPRIEAIFASSDENAIGVIKLYQDTNLKVPIIIGEENQPIGEFLDFSSIDFRPNEIGSEAVKMCLEGVTEKRVLTSEVIMRGVLRHWHECKIPPSL